MKDLFGPQLHDPRPRPRARPGAPCGMRHEREAMADGAILVCGVDEAGRGPLAGPVTAAAVILPARGIPRGLNDSKKLNAAERERRLETAREELAAESEFDVTIVNDRVERATDELAALIGVRDLT